MFILISSIRNECESECSIDYPICISSSKEKLEAKMFELENIQTNNANICDKFVKEYRKWVASKQHLSFRDYISANDDFINSLRKTYAEKYYIDPNILHVYTYTKFSYSIKEIEEI